MFSKPVLSYLAILVAFGLSLAFILQIGETLTSSASSAPPVSLPAPAGAVGAAPLSGTLTDVAARFGAELQKNLRQPVGLLLLQTLVIMLFAKLCAAAIQGLGQPKVIGEILAGILLGPSALGLLWPEANHFLFPAESLPLLQFMSQLGLLLFMFIVGMEVDLNFIRKRFRAAVLVSHVSVIFPFLLGAVLALFLFTDFAPPSVSFTAFGLFMGTAMSITAFPVLARILQERQLTRTALGTMALTCAAVGDLTAWCILALVVGIVRAGTIYTAMPTVLLATLYIILMIWLLRPALERRLRADRGDAHLMTTTFMLLFGSALLSEVIGIHALFGAFLAGVVMPAREDLRGTVTDRLEHVSTVVLLPLFFAFTGLRIQIGLLNDVVSWLVCGLIILVAVLGKLGGSALAARWMGINWRNATALGVLMNTRGLMELVVLNIGYDLGILSAKVFTMMVIMALVTTVMTGPLLDWSLRRRGATRAKVIIY